MRLVIASRKSDLARIQAYHVASKIKAAFPDIQIEHNFSASFGDKNQDISLFNMPEKGSFTQDFRDGLIDGSFDLVVHSWKDLPTDMEPTSIIHTVKREDPRDVLLIKKSNKHSIISNKKLEILTSSPRRMYGLDLILKDLLPGDINSLNFKEVRGNIPTRLQKLIEGDSDALVIAKAALDRMLHFERDEFESVSKQTRAYLDQCLWMILPLSVFPTAAAQGALAIESHKENHKLNEILKEIHDEQCALNVHLEREILRSYGGGCHQKIGINVATYEFGKVSSLVGKTSKGEILNEYKLLDQSDEVTKSFWPKDPKATSFFLRDEFNPKLAQDNYWVSRENSLPADWKQEERSLLWCAGLKTWVKLASRGYWVNGCSDGLGEEVEQSIDRISDNAKWTKLSHDKSFTSKYNVTSTYALIPKESPPEIEECDEYYWMSATQFEEAFKHNPWLKSKVHYCGPGFTAKTLKKHIDEKKIRLELSYDLWIKKRTNK